MIPKVVHYCWFGPSPMTPLGKECIASWRRVMPDFRLEVWNESRLDLKNPYIRIAYEAGKFAFVADYVRLITLYEFGGIYMDTDVEVIKRMDDLCHEPMFIGMESPSIVGVAVIGARKRHALIGALIEKLDDEARTGRLSYRPLPDLVTEILEQGGKHSLRILPEDYFYPYNPYSPNPLRKKPLQSHITEQTRCIHHWEGSWLGDISLRELMISRMRELWRKHRTPRAARPGMGREAPASRSEVTQNANP